MAAEVNTVTLNGVSPGTPTTISDGASLRFQMIDAFAYDDSKAILRPLAGSYYTYWKSIYLNCTISPPTAINNVKLYSTGSIPWTGVSLWVGDETPTVGNYVQATGTEGKTGLEMVASHPGISARTAMATYTSGSPISVPGSISNPNVGAISYLVILQMQIDTNVVSGSSGGATLTWRYDES